MYPKTPGCFSDLSAALYYKSYCFFLKLLIVLPVHFPLLHFTPPKVLRFYYNLTFRCVRYFGGSAIPSGLNSNSTFYFRIVATNSAGTTYGDTLSFTTLSSSTTTPTVSSVSPNTITQGTSYQNVTVYGSYFTS